MLRPLNPNCRWECREMSKLGQEANETGPQMMPFGHMSTKSKDNNTGKIHSSSITWWYFSAFSTLWWKHLWGGGGGAEATGSLTVSCCWSASVQLNACICLRVKRAHQSWNTVLMYVSVHLCVSVIEVSGCRRQESKGLVSIQPWIWYLTNTSKTGAVTYKRQYFIHLYNVFIQLHGRYGQTQDARCCKPSGGTSLKIWTSLPLRWYELFTWPQSIYNQL